MNNKFSTIINVSLIVAVAVLYYLHFSDCNRSCGPDGATDSTLTAAPVVMSPKEIKASKIVYVNSDVLNEKYEYVKTLVAAAQAKQQRLEVAYQTKGQKLQQDYAEFQQKAGQGLLSENEINRKQEEFQKRKEELDMAEQELQGIMEEMQVNYNKVRKTIVDYLKEYNKKSNYNYILTYSKTPGSGIILADDSLDITNEVLEGLNAQYRAEKGKK